MGETTYIHITECCTHYDIEKSFIEQLQEYDIVHIEKTDNELMISEQELSILEKMVRLHHELDINPQGLQAVHHLLEKVNDLQTEVTLLRRKLNRFRD